jgi:glycerol-3-phosphate responsive antiterminator
MRPASPVRHPGSQPSRRSPLRKTPDTVEIVPALAPLPSEAIFDKITMSAFAGGVFQIDVETICRLFRSRSTVNDRAGYAASV